MIMPGFMETLPDIPRVITALAEWMAAMACLVAAKKRIHGWKFVAVSVLFLCVQSVFLCMTDGLEGIGWNLCMLTAFFILYLFIRTCSFIESKNAVCCCATAFIASEFVASLEWQIWCYAHDLLELKQIPWFWIILGGVYVLLFFVGWQLNRKIIMSDEEVDVSMREAVSIVLISLFIFAVSNLGFLPIRLPFAGRDSLEIFNMRTLVDGAGLAALYAYQAQMKSTRVRQELQAIQNILQSQYVQYKQAQRTVDLINYRYHDLKNHIIALRAGADNSGKNEYLDKLEQEIQEYEALNKTGNQVLDTLLTSKNLRCMEHKIEMTCVVDGALFDFMDVMDICSIFGNALDNAIESELKIRDYGKRMIHVAAFSEKSFLIIRFDNYYEGDIYFEKGLPVTSKEEKNSHGYGLKSLQYTVHKYKGEVQIDTKDNWFSLRVLIPF